jgi:transcriptional regulator with XRE-family HTH domain
MQDINKTTANNIHEVRKKQGIKALDLAERLGISESAYSQLETGKIQITIVRLYSIAKELQVPISTLLPDSQPMVQINRDNSSHNVLGTQINQTDPSIRDMIKIIWEKVK